VSSLHVHSCSQTATCLAICSTVRVLRLLVVHRTCIPPPPGHKYFMSCVPCGPGDVLARIPVEMLWVQHDTSATEEVRRTQGHTHPVCNAFGCATFGCGFCLAPALRLLCWQQPLEAQRVCILQHQCYATFKALQPQVAPLSGLQGMLQYTPSGHTISSMHVKCVTLPVV